MFVFFLKASPAKYWIFLPFPPSTRHQISFIFLPLLPSCLDFGSASLRQEEHHLFKVIMSIGIMNERSPAKYTERSNWDSTNITDSLPLRSLKIAHMWTWMAFVSFSFAKAETRALQSSMLFVAEMCISFRGLQRFSLMSFRIHFPCRTTNEEETSTKISNYNRLMGQPVLTRKLDQIHSI